MKFRMLMLRAVSKVFRDESSLLIWFGASLLVYYACMDTVMYMTFMHTDLVESSRLAGPEEVFSPFTHISVKSLMNDHTTGYVGAPLAEYIDILTGFSTVFYFVTPNMVGAFHVLVAFFAAWLISSDDLHSRRAGVLVFFVRNVLDSLDGVVFRSHSHTRGVYQSVRSSWGHYVDSTCDFFGGFFLLLGVCVYLIGRFNPSELLWDSDWSPCKRGSVLRCNLQGFVSKTNWLLAWKGTCFVATMGISGVLWDRVVSHLTELYQKPLDSREKSELQFDISHSTSSMLLMYAWRLLEGQALEHYLLAAIFVDKVWQLLNVCQYVTIVVAVGLYVVSVLYIQHVESLLQMK